MPPIIKRCIKMTWQCHSPSPPSLPYTRTRAFHITDRISLAVKKVQSQIFFFIHSIAHQWEGNGNSLQCSCLESPMEGGAWWTTVHRVTKSQTQLSYLKKKERKEKEWVSSGCNLSWNTFTRTSYFSFVDLNILTKSNCAELRVVVKIKWDNVKYLA